MRRRLFIGLAVSLGVNFLAFVVIVGMAIHNDIPLEKIFPVDLIKIMVEKPPPPPPPPPPKPKKKKDEEKITPTKAPIESSDDPEETASIQTSPVIEDKPVPTIVNFTELDYPPKRTRFVKPKYPTIARRAGKTGIVVVKFLITKSGNVTNVKIIRSPGGLGFEESVIKAVSGWKYQTPMMNGQAVAAWCVTPVRFKLD
jgi:periplasmic protein TonB